MKDITVMKIIILIVGINVIFTIILINAQDKYPTFINKLIKSINELAIFAMFFVFAMPIVGLFNYENKDLLKIVLVIGFICANIAVLPLFVKEKKWEEREGHYD